MIFALGLGVLHHAISEHLAIEGKGGEGRAKFVGDGGDKPAATLAEFDRRIIAALPESVVSVKPGYESLAAVLQKAHDQAAIGKGKERHANGLPFEDQPMSVINRQLGSIHGFIYQAQKKSLEATRLPKERAVAELLGAINYLAGAVIALEAQP